MQLLAPHVTDPARLDATMHERGYAVLTPQAVCGLAGCTLEQLMALQPGWDDLPPDHGHERTDPRWAALVERSGEDRPDSQEK